MKTIKVGLLYFHDLTSFLGFMQVDTKKPTFMEDGRKCLLRFKVIGREQSRIMKKSWENVCEVWQSVVFALIKCF